MAGIALPVEAKRDDRSFRQVADYAEKTFAKAGDDAGSSFGKKFSDGVRSATPEIQKAYDKVADTVGKVRTEQAKLNELMSKGNASDAQKIAASERLSRAQRDQARAVAEASTAFRNADVSASKFQSTMRNFAAGSLSNNTFLRSADVDMVFGKLGDVSSRAAVAATGVAAVGAAAVVAGRQLYEMGARWDDITDTIAVKTGKVGGELDSIVASVKNVGSSTAAPLEDIGNIAGQVVQSLRLTGQPLEQMTKTLADLQQMTGEGVDVKTLGQTFRLFDVKDAEAQRAALDQLFGVSQATGISVNELIGTLQSTGKVAKEFGFDIGQTAGLVASLEEAGVSFEKAGPGLTIALRNFAKDGREPQQALRETIAEIDRLVEAGNGAAATKLASETFGKGYIDFLNAIKDGKLDVDGLSAALTNTTTSIEGTRDATADWSEQWQTLKNRITTTMEPLASATFSGINSQLEWVGESIGSVVDLVHGFGQAWTELSALVSGNPIKLNVQTGPMTLGPGGIPIPTSQPTAGPNPLTVFGPNPAAPGANPSTGTTLDQILELTPATPAAPLPPPTTNPSTPATGVGPNFYKDWYPDQSGSGPKLPDAPVVPRAGLPSLQYGLQPTSALYSAQSSVADSQTELAEKEARLNQLKQSNVATADDIQKAENDVAKARESANSAQMRFAEAQQSALESQTKSLKQVSGSMDQIGAALDNDLGISKGLPGLADNLVRFVASLAAAPLLGQLSAISAANPNQGSGLIGMLGSTGAFGPQYTPGYGVGPAAAAGGAGGAYPGDAALLAGVPAGTYTQEGRGDLTQGLADCSSAVEDLVNIMDGRPTGGASMYTGNAAEWLTSRGFLPGMGGPGDFRVGFNDSHMQATLPGGTPFNWGSQASAANRGIGGRGADDPAFTQHYYRPAGSMNGFGLPTTNSPVPVNIVGGLNFDALAQPESGGNWANKSNPKYRGGLQFDIPTWNQYMPSGAPGDPADASREQQIQAAMNALNSGRSPQSLWPQNYQQLYTPGGGGGAGSGWGSDGAALPSLAGVTGGGEGPIFGFPQTPATGIGGPGIGSSAGLGLPGGGTGAQPAGMAYPAMPGGGGIGAGGMAMDAAMMGAGALNAIAPGAGAAAQIGIQLANRAIKYAGQVAGIGVSGLFETLSVGDNPMGSIGNSWFGKLAGGLAGARPALPNTAGQKPPQQPGQGSPMEALAQKAGNTANITIHNNGATPDQNGKDVAAHTAAMWAPAGRQ